ncbi:MAG: ATP-dependent helicase [Lachnospiraceae bacterium]|nr:ATP-dependent helicase [Lachnospiraceae bacterium]
MIEFELKPSKCVEEYFVHKCERNLFYGGLKSAGRRSFELDDPTGTGSPIAAQAGEKWEEKVASEIIPQEKLHAKTEVKDGRLSYLKFTYDETMEELRRIAESVKVTHETEYLYQGYLKASEGFKAEWFRFDESLYNGEDDNLNVDIPKAYPDLISAEWSEDNNRVMLSVIDVKLARRMKLAHKVQVALYVKMLEALIDEYNAAVEDDKKIDAIVNTDTGYLWNGGQDAERPFELKEENGLLDMYFSEVLPELVNKAKEALVNGEEQTLKSELKRCVGPKCEWCQNYKQCMRELKEQGSIKLIPYLSEYAQAYAERLNAPETIPEFADYAAVEENKDTLSSNRSWDMILGDGVTLEVQRRAVPYSTDFNELRWIGYTWKEHRSFTMPKWQDVAIVLTAQKYAGDNRVYVFGINTLFYERNGEAQGNEDNNGPWRESFEAFVMEDDSEEAYFNNLRDFITRLYEILESYDEGNGGIQKSVQAYVMDSYELMNLEEALYEALDSLENDEEIINRIISVLLWLQGDRVVDGTEEQPDDVGEFPIIVISNELRKLVSLPLPVAYRLPEVVNSMNVFVPRGMVFNRVDYRLFFDALTNTMRSDAIHAVWNGETECEGLEVSTDLICEHIHKRLVAETGIVRKLQKAGAENGRLVRKLNNFVLPGRAGYQNRLLRKWFFEAKNESLYQYQQIRQARLQGVEAAMETGDVLRMTLTDCRVVQVGRYQKTRITLFAEGNTDVVRDKWISIVFVEVDDVEELYKYEDYRFKNLFIAGWFPERVNVVNIPKYERDANHIVITGDVARGNISAADVGKDYYVSLRYTDINSKKLFDTFDIIDEEGNPPDTSRLLLERPEDVRLLTEDLIEDDFSDGMFSYSNIGNCNFTESQRNAFTHLYEKRMTVLQGPPGTGKSDFIARAIITLCRYYKAEKNRNLRVLVTANTHSAIENILRMLSKKIGERRDISLYKSNRLEDESIENVSVTEENSDYGATIYDVMRADDVERPLVCGATVWSCANIVKNNNRQRQERFDLIIIDEASQLRVMDAMLAMYMGDVERSRYLLVGDDDQLPAIIQGRYGTDSDKAYEYGSVFSYYRAKALDHEENRIMLEENFRMNEIILRYSAEKIYGSRYRSHGGRDGEVANRRLNYEGVPEDVADEDMPWLTYMLDSFENTPDYWPMVFCKISGGTLKQQEDTERRVVTVLTDAIRNSVHAETEEAFWRGTESIDGVLGIVSPHHRHIEKLKDKISTETGMDRSNLFIGTVDKLQGQQRDAVIVSYGVTDLESAVTEGEFIFNRNRLNVALTRAKCKSITVFSEVLTTPSSTMLDTEDEDLQKGIEFVCGLLPFMQKEEDDTEVSSAVFELEDGVSLNIYRKRIR